MIVLAVSPVLLAEEELRIVASPNVTVSEISVADVEAYFSKRKLTWPDQSPVRPITWFEGMPARRIFLNKVLRKSESEVAQFWMLQKLNTGRSQPLRLDEASAICDLLQSLEGGIGYILPDDHTDSCLSLKLLTVIK